MVPKLAVGAVVIVLHRQSWMLRELVAFTQRPVRRDPGPRALRRAHRVLPVDASMLLAFLLVLSRTASWAMTTPMLSTKGMSAVARLGFAIPLSVFVAMLAPPGQVPTDLPGFVGQALVQVGVGLALGFLTGLLFAAVEIAGTLADYSSGFSFGAILDPISGAQSAGFARLNSAVFLALLVATNSHLAIVKRLRRSPSRSIPVGTVPDPVGHRRRGAGPRAHRDHGLGPADRRAAARGALPHRRRARASRPASPRRPTRCSWRCRSRAWSPWSPPGAMLTLLPAYLDRALLPALELPGIVLAVSGEKTEKATPKKLQDLRKKGSVPRSQDLPAGVGLLALVLVLPIGIARAGGGPVLGHGRPADRRRRPGRHHRLRGGPRRADGTRRSHLDAADDRRGRGLQHPGRRAGDPVQAEPVRAEAEDQEPQPGHGRQAAALEGEGRRGGQELREAHRPRPGGLRRLEGRLRAADRGLLHPRRLHRRRGRDPALDDAADRPGRRADRRRRRGDLDPAVRQAVEDEQARREGGGEVRRGQPARQGLDAGAGAADGARPDDPGRRRRRRRAGQPHPHRRRAEVHPRQVRPGRGRPRRRRDRRADQGRGAASTASRSSRTSRWPARSTAPPRSATSSPPSSSAPWPRSSPRSTGPASPVSPPGGPHEHRPAAPGVHLADGPGGRPDAHHQRHRDDGHPAAAGAARPAARDEPVRSPWSS